MSDYTVATDFAAKDALPGGDSNKIIRGTEFDTEFDAIAVAIATKANSAGAALTGNSTSDGNEIGWRKAVQVTSTGETLAASHSGKSISTTGNMTVANSVFGAGDAVVIYNNSASAITLTQGSGVTMRLAGTTTTGSRTLSGRGLASLYFVSASEVVVSGAGIS
jgi:hypothetical protein